MKFKIGDKVKMNKVGLRVFYGTNKNMDMFLVKDEIKNEHFIQYVAYISGFENGCNPGTVIGFNSLGECYIMFDSFMGPLRGYYSSRHLDLVKGV